MPSLKYYGHSAFRIEDEKHTVFIDPFISGNPVCTSKLEDIRKCDYILLTHAHADHYGDTEALAKKFDATVICTWELAGWFQRRMVKAHPMSTGGSFAFPFGRVKVTLAFHGVGGDPRPDGSVPPPNSPVGYLVHWGKNKVLYHAGDTALFDEMKLYGEQHEIDVACLPIGDNFTMGVEDASKAAEFLKAKTCVPMHYNTFEIIKADPLNFAFHVEKQGARCKVMSPGEKFAF
ncbi:MAG: metal-dependent hydrolase [Planctomycetota bacterium]|nr:metal-dependent hydrolase [Planctomycetota bacterium]